MFTVNKMQLEKTCIEYIIFKCQLLWNKYNDSLQRCSIPIITTEKLSTIIWYEYKLRVADERAHILLNTGDY